MFQGLCLSGPAKRKVGARKRGREGEERGNQGHRIFLSPPPSPLRHFLFALTSLFTCLELLRAWYTLESNSLKNQNSSKIILRCILITMSF